MGSAARRSRCASSPRGSPAPGSPSIAASSPAIAARRTSCGISTAQQWCGSVRRRSTGSAETCDTVLAGGLSMGAILALDVALRRPDGVHGLLLFAPTFQARRLGDAVDEPAHPRRGPADAMARNIYLKERPPYGIKDERIRAFVVIEHAKRGFEHGRRVLDAAAFVRAFQRLVRARQAAARRDQGAGADPASARRRHGEPGQCDRHPAQARRASSSSSCSTTAIISSRSTGSAISSSTGAVAFAETLDRSRSVAEQRAGSPAAHRAQRVGSDVST